jgi:Uma2 family endonuclease
MYVYKKAIMEDLLAPILKSINPKALIDELSERWAAEQQKRHQFWAAVDENRKAEFIEGKIIYHSPVYGRHWMISTKLLTRLLPFVEQHDLGKVGCEKVMIRCTRNDYEPDICFWKKEIADRFQPLQSAFPPPNFIIEILSSSTEHRDRGIKFMDYALHGVEEYWIIDPEAMSIEQYSLNSASQYELQAKATHGEIKSNVIIGFNLPVEAIFK